MDDEPIQDDHQPLPTQGQFLQALRERWWVVVACVIVVMGVALAQSYRQTPQYKATAQIAQQQTSLERALFGTQLLQVTDASVQTKTDAALVNTPDVAALVRKELNSARSPAELAAMVSASAGTDTNLITVSAVSPSATEASDVANSFARQFIAYRAASDQQAVALAQKVVQKQLSTMTAADLNSDLGKLLQQRLEQLGIVQELQTGGYTVSRAAATPGAPFSPAWVRTGILALLVGVVVGSGLALLLWYADKRVKDEKTLEASYNLPVLASIPDIGGRWDDGPTSKRPSRSVTIGSSPALLEPFRTLRTALRYFDVNGPVRTILVTSGLPKEGKTVVTANLALSLAFAGQRVVVVEADLRRPMIYKYLGVKNEVGLSTVLAGAKKLSEALQLVELEAFVPQGTEGQVEEVDGISLHKNLYCLASGPLPPNPAELLSSKRMEVLLKEFAKSGEVDYVVIDSPPVLSVADALILASTVDAVIVTARMNATKRDEAREVRDRLSRAGANVIGVVATGVKAKKGYYQRTEYSRASSPA
jgi:polysaccharide biosynthesis transport protein